MEKCTNKLSNWSNAIIKHGEKGRRKGERERIRNWEKSKFILIDVCVVFQSMTRLVMLLDLGILTANNIAVWETKKMRCWIYTKYIWLTEPIGLKQFSPTMIQLLLQDEYEDDRCSGENMLYYSANHTHNLKVRTLCFICEKIQNSRVCID